MGKQLYSSFTTGKNLIVQSVCMLLLSFVLVAGADEDVQAAVSPAPVLEAVQVSGTDFTLKWSQPDSVYGAPDGGYDIIVDGVDTNNTHRTSGLSASISGLSPGEHTFQVEARFTETSEFHRSNVVNGTLESGTPTVPEEPTAPTEPDTPDGTPSATSTVPVLEAVQLSGTDFVLAWSQPDSVYGAPDGGYDIIVDGVDTNNTHRTSGLSASISGLSPGEHTFQVEARFTETSEFHRSNVVSGTLESGTPTVPEEPTAPTEPDTPDGTPSATTTVPVLEPVQLSGTDFVLAWSQPDSAYGAPDGGYDIIVDGVDTNKKNRTSGLSASISGLAPGEHTFQVEARYTETREFHRSNVVSAVLEDSVDPTLSSLAISGPASLDENASATFKATATWTDGSTSAAAPNWSENSAYATISTNGVLTVSAVTADQTVIVTASYTSGGVTRTATKSVLISDVPATLPPQITLAWDPTTDPEVIGYRLYYKESDANDPSYNTEPFDGTGLTEGGSPIDIGFNETYTLNLPQDTTVFCFAVTAYNADGVESEYSNIACTGN